MKLKYLNILIGMSIILVIVSLLFVVVSGEPTGGEYHEVQTGNEDGTSIYVTIEVNVYVEDYELECAVRDSVDNFTVFELFDNLQSNVSIDNLMRMILGEIQVIDAEITHIMIRYNDKEIERPIIEEEDDNTFYLVLIIVLILAIIIIMILMFILE